MDIDSLTSDELHALLIFLEDYFNIDTVEEHLAKNLFSAYIKMNKVKKQWDEAMAYTE